MTSTTERSGAIAARFEAETMTWSGSALSLYEAVRDRQEPADPHTVSRVPSSPATPTRAVWSSSCSTWEWATAV